MELVKKIQLKAEPSRLKSLRDDVRLAISGLCDIEYLDKLIIAINEAAMNVIQHAYNTNNEGLMVLEIYKENDRLIFHLVDYAAPVDTNKVKPRNLDDIRPGGLGTHFISEIMEDVYFLDNKNDAGNVLVMKAHKHPAKENS